MTDVLLLGVGILSLLAFVSIMRILRNLPPMVKLYITVRKEAKKWQ